MGYIERKPVKIYNINQKVTKKKDRREELEESNILLCETRGDIV